MTENATPKPLDISCRKCQSRENSFLGLSINQSKDPFTIKLAEQNSNQRLSKM